MSKIDKNKVAKIIKSLAESKESVPQIGNKTDYIKYNNQPHVMEAKLKLIKLGVTHDYLVENFAGAAIVLDMPDSPIVID